MNVQAALRRFRPRFQPFGKARIGFDGNKFPGAFLEQCPGQTTWSRPNFDHGAALDGTGCKCGSPENIRVEQEVLAQCLAGPALRQFRIIGRLRHEQAGWMPSCGRA